MIPVEPIFEGPKWSGISPVSEKDDFMRCALYESIEILVEPQLLVVVAPTLLNAGLFRYLRSTHPRAKILVPTHSFDPSHELGVSGVPIGVPSEWIREYISELDRNEVEALYRRHLQPEK